MTTTNPPTYYFTGIDYNDAFYTSTSSNITQSQADARYLIKSANDSAVGIETFTNGIITDSIQPISNADTVNLLTTQTGALNIGTSASRNTAININNTAGSTGAVNIGNSTNTTLIGNAYSFVNSRITPTVAHSYYDGSPSGATDLVNNVVAGNVDMLGTQTTGYLNICNGGKTGQINIMNATNSAGTFNLGTLCTGNTAVNIGSINSGTQIVTILGQGALHLNDGNSNSGITHINNGLGNAGAVNIQNTGTDAVTHNTGNCNIQTGPYNSGILNVQTSSTGSGSVNIGNSGNTTGVLNLYSHNINIGSSGDTTGILGLNLPLQPNYSGTFPSTMSMVGYQNSTTTSSTVPTSSLAVIAQTPTITNGVWMIEAEFTATWTGTPTESLIVWSLSTSNTTNDPLRILTQNLNKNLITSTYSNRLTSIFRLSGAGQPLYLLAQVNGTNPTSCASAIIYTRIA